MSPDEGGPDPASFAALAPLDPCVAAAMTAIVLALVVAVFLLVLINDDEFSR